MARTIVLVQKTTLQMMRYKLLFPATREIPGRIYECYQYESRSGLHWHHCYSSKDGKPVYGYVRLLRKIFEYAPQDYEDLDKPIPREAKNIVGIETMREAEKIVVKLAGFTDALVIASESAVEAWLYRRYDRRLVLPPEPIARQANLAIYAIDPVPRWLERLKYKWRRSVEVSGHVLAFSKPLYVATAERLETKWVTIDAAIIAVSEPLRLRILHPEHEEVTVKLEPGYYFIEHVSTPLDR